MRAGLLGALLLAGCAASLRQPVTPPLPGTPTSAPWLMRRELLLPETSRILFIVEWIDGEHPPIRAALDALVRLAARYGERPASWIAADDPRAPPQGRLPGDTSFIIVRYVGDRIPNWGLSTWEGRAGFIQVNQDKMQRWSTAMLSRRRLETQTLVHEYGHLLGLPTLDHEYYPEYPSTAGGRHCVNPDCALTRPTVRALLYGLVHTILGGHYIDDYCDACRRVIRDAKAFFRRQGV